MVLQLRTGERWLLFLDDSGTLTPHYADSDSKFKWVAKHIPLFFVPL